MTEKEIWNALREKGFTDFAAAGIMGNFQAESAMKADNVEDRCPMSDAAYTTAADNGTTDFIFDGYGYGLPQFTFWSLKRELLTLCRERGTSVADAQAQIDCLCTLLERDYPNTLTRLQNAASPCAASTVFLLEFERPADSSKRVQDYRASLAEELYRKYHGAEDGEAGEGKLPLSAESIAHLQLVLRSAGFDLAVDGILGPKTRAAIGELARKVRS